MYRFQPVAFQDCTFDGLKAAYTGDFGFIKDGLLFYNKASHYTKGLNPLVLAWRDRATSRFAVDSPDGLTPFPTQSCVLQLVRRKGAYALAAHGRDVVQIVPVNLPPIWNATEGR